MSEKEFLSWLKGFIEGRQSTLDTHTTGFEILSTISNKIELVVERSEIENFDFKYFSKPSIV